jgi:hypothetical protein
MRGKACRTRGWGWRLGLGSAVGTSPLCHCVLYPGDAALWHGLNGPYQQQTAAPI